MVGLSNEKEKRMKYVVIAMEACKEGRVVLGEEGGIKDFKCNGP